jgi:hypothetical protein
VSQSIVLAVRANATITGMTVGNMENLRDLVTAVDFSEVTFTDSIISDNDIPDAGWLAFQAELDSVVSVSNVTLARNTGVEFVALATGGSSIILELVELIELTSVPFPVSIFILAWLESIAVRAGTNLTLTSR